MQLVDYDKGLLVMACWRLAQNNDVNELVAIACVIRNWVVARAWVAPQQFSFPGTVGQVHFASYSAAVEAFLNLYPVRALPATNEPALVDPIEGLLAQIDGIYGCTTPDLTSSRSFPAGARYFSRAAHAPPWFRDAVLARPDEHPLIGNFGSQSFYA